MVICNLHTVSFSRMKLLLGTATIIFLHLTHFYFTEIESNGRKLNVENSTDNSSVRVFDVWDREKVPFPCVAEDSPDSQGIFYIKVPKTSSSSLGKITARIAGREAIRQGLDNQTCKIYDPYLLHQSAFYLNCVNRDKSKSLLWSVIRRPSSRAISHYNMIINHGYVDSEFETFKKTLEQDDRFTPNKQLDYLLPSHDLSKMEVDDIVYPELVRSVMQEYNFIGIYERLYESLVVFSLLIGVGVSDMLFDWQPTFHSRCGVLDDPKWVLSEHKDFVESNEWKKRDEGDNLLYETVNKSLDLTIEMLGKDLVKTELENFQKLIAIGTNEGIRQRKETGCGIPGINHRQEPYVDIDELSWFDNLSPEDQQFVKDIK